MAEMIPDVWEKTAVFLAINARAVPLVCLERGEVAHLESAVAINLLRLNNPCESACFTTVLLNIILDMASLHNCYNYKFI